MMMRKKTQGRAQLRYALTLPLLVALGFLFAQINIEAQVPTTSQNSTLPPPPPMMAPGAVEKGKAEAPYSSMSKEVIIRTDTTPKVFEERVVQDFPSNTNQLKGQVINGYPSRTNSINELVVVGYTPIRDSIPGEVFKVVEKMPEYPGGSVELLRF
nr:hypothetical protein [Haliscomenobacter sp.]